MVSKTEEEIIESVVEHLNSLGFVRIITDELIPTESHFSNRADVVVYDDKNDPYFLVEVKTKLPNELTKFHPAVDQAFSYATALGARYFLVTDSEKYFWYEISSSEFQGKFKELHAHPSVPSISEVDEPGVVKLSVSSLRVPSSWSDIVLRLQDILRDTLTIEKSRKVVLELLVAKKYDQKIHEIGSSYDFQVFVGEASEETKSRVLRLRNEARETYSYDWLDFEELVNLDSIIVQKLVRILQPYSLGGFDEVSPDPSYLVSSLLKEAGHVYYTPSEIANFLVSLFEIKEGDFILDPACGVGGFLVAVAKQINRELPNSWPRLIGIEIRKDISLVSIINMIVNGIENFDILTRDFLTLSTKKELDNIQPSNFDFVFCDPPFGTLRELDGVHTLGSFKPTRRTKRLEIEKLFMIAILEYLKPKGLAAIVTPESVLSLKKHADFREYLLSKAHIKAVISLPNELYPYTGAKTNLLILQKIGKVAAIQPTLMMRVPITDRREVDHHLFKLASDAYKYFLKTQKIKKESRDRLSATLVEEITENNSYRLDFAAYAPKYLRLLEKLEAGPYPIARLGDIADVRLGIRIRTSDSGHIPVISASDVRFDGLSFSQIKFTSDDVSSRSLIHPGDLLVSGIRRESPVVLVSEQFEMAVADSSMVVISLKSDEILPKYLLAVLNHEIVKVQLEHLAVGATVRRINPQILSEVKIPILSKVDQAKVARHIDKVDEYRSLTIASMENAQMLINKALSFPSGEETNETA